MSVIFNPFTGNLDFNDTTKAAGSDTQVQFNDGGKLGGDSGLVFNKTTNKLTAGGDVELNDGGSFTTTLQTVTPTANRTISFPDATGTVGLVAGSSGQVVYNNAGAYAGVSTMTFDGASVTLAGRLINSYTSLASSPAKVFTGTWFTGGTSTTTKPHFLIEPSGATSTAWSTSGTGLGVNAASGFVGRLLDLQVNGSPRLFVGSGGGISIMRADGTANYHVLGSTGVQNDLGIQTAGSDASFTILPNSTERARFKPTVEAVINDPGNDYDFRVEGDTDANLFFCDASVDRVGVKTNAPTAALDINSDILRVRTAKTPASATDTGNAGDHCWDANYLYVCTATNTWKRAALSTW